jgi:hypothetical protein
VAGYGVSGRPILRLRALRCPPRPNWALAHGTIVGHGCRYMALVLLKVSEMSYFAKSHKMLESFRVITLSPHGKCIDSCRISGAKVIHKTECCILHTHGSSPLWIRSCFALLATTNALEVRVRNIFVSTRLGNTFCRPLIRVPLLHPPHVLIEPRKARVVQWNTLSTSLQRKVYHDVRTRELVSTEEFTRRLGEEVFEKVAVLFQLRVKERVFYLVGDSVSDWFEEEGNRGFLDVCGR